MGAIADGFAFVKWFARAAVTYSGPWADHRNRGIIGIIGPGSINPDAGIPGTAIKPALFFVCLRVSSVSNGLRTHGSSNNNNTKKKLEGRKKKQNGNNILDIQSW